MRCSYISAVGARPHNFGARTALGVCLYVFVYDCADNNFWMTCDRILHGTSNFTISRSCSNVNVIGARSQSSVHDEKCPFPDARYEMTYILNHHMVVQTSAHDNYAMYWLFVKLFVLKWSVRPRVKAVCLYFVRIFFSYFLVFSIQESLV